MDETIISKTEMAYRVLRRDILEVRLKPCFPLKLESVQKTYGIGWTPLREALTRLEAERLVIATANKGFAVAPVSMEELLDLTKSKRLVEAQLLAEAIDTGDEQWETEIVAAHYRLSRYPSPMETIDDHQAFIEWGERHEAFHLALLAANKSPWLTSFYKQVTDHMRRHGRVLKFALSPATLSADRERGGREIAILESAYSIQSHSTLMAAVLERRKSDALDLLSEHTQLTQLAYEALGSTGLTIDADLNAG